jgi:D-glycero-alpha-D-manno-heptose 1-phosphate guanylyltransferase
MIKECIILAGGLGTRLRSEVADLPKCMAPVAGKPFLHWVINYAIQQGVTRFIFSLGYLHEKIEDYIATDYPTLDTKFSVEKEPLGTGGAINLAIQLCKEENVLVLNGDTLFEVNNKILFDTHIKQNADCSLVLKPMVDFVRYGSVTINENEEIVSFEEKKQVDKGLINGGVYLIKKDAFVKIDFPNKFSFEKDYLEEYVTTKKMMAVINNGYFIDIGIPTDFKKANVDFKNRQ